jgi:predicted MFS family arabinose efflux permease
MAIPFGSALGYLLGGQLGQHFGWRSAFFIVAVPGIILGLFAFKLTDSTRHKISKKTFPSIKQYFSLFKNKTFICIALSQAMATFTLGGLAAWMPTYFHRYFDLSVAKAATVFGIITIFGATLGTFTGGHIADFLNKRTKKGYYITSAAGFFISIPFAVTAVLNGSYLTASVMFFMALFFVFFYAGPLPAAIISSVKTGIHSMAFAVNIFILHALGDAISPTIIGALSDKFDLKFATLICIGFLALAGFFALLAALFHKKEGK